MWIRVKSKNLPIEFSCKEKQFKKYFKYKSKISLTDISTKTAPSCLIIIKEGDFNNKEIISFIKIVKPEIKKGGKKAAASLLMRVDNILTKKPKDTRMGRGKGAPSDKTHHGLAGAPLLTLHKITDSFSYNLLKKVHHKVKIKNNILHLKKW